jgi:hypothetical protein
VLLIRGEVFEIIMNDGTYFNSQTIEFLTNHFAFIFHVQKNVIFHSSAKLVHKDIIHFIQRYDKAFKLSISVLFAENFVMQQLSDCSIKKYEYDAGGNNNFLIPRAHKLLMSP